VTQPHETPETPAADEAKGTPAPDRTIWIDGRRVPWAQATLHVLGQSVQRGSLVFDVMSCHWPDGGPAVFGLREHVDRFINSAKISGMTLSVDRDALLAGIGEAVRANPGATTVKLSGYYPSPSLDVLPRDATASVAVAAFSQQDIVPGYEAPGRPARLQIADPRKMPDWVMSPQAKLAAGYLYTSIAKGRARAEGFDDVLLLDQAGRVAESSTQSFFWVQHGRVYTAPVEIVLAGVTRRVVIELARDEGLTVCEESHPKAVLDAADEAFLTGTSSSVWAVGQIDDRTFADAPGPISKRLRERLDRLLDGKDPRFSPIWLQSV